MDDIEREETARIILEQREAGFREAIFALEMLNDIDGSNKYDDAILKLNAIISGGYSRDEEIKFAMSEYFKILEQKRQEKD